MTTYPRPTDPVSALALANATEAHSAAHGRLLGLSWQNVKHHGAVGDGTVDDSAAIQSALDAVDANRGGVVYFPLSVLGYRLATGLVCSIQGTILLGEGMPGTSSTEANGSTQIRTDAGITAIRFDTGSHGTLGMGMKNIHVRPMPSVSTGNGIVVDDIERMLFEDVTISDYASGTGLSFTAGVGGNCQYAILRNLSVGGCLVGVHFGAVSANGALIEGGYFSNALTPPANSIGIWIEYGDTQKLYGTVIQGYQTGVLIESAAGGQELHGARFEFCNTGIRIESPAYNVGIFGGSFDNTLLGGSRSPNIGIQIDSGVSNTLVDVAPWTPSNSIATPISDNGTNTRYGQQFGRWAQAAVLGSVVGKVRQYDESGNFVGYVPVYDNITGISLVKRHGASNPDTTGVTSMSLTVATGGAPIGDTIILAVLYGSASTVTVSASDSRGNTYVSHVGGNNTTGSYNPHSAILSSTLTTALQAGDLITIAFSAGVSRPVGFSYQYTGMHATRLDQTAGASGNASSSPASGAVTTGYANELCFAVITSGNVPNPTFTPGSGFTQLDAAQNTTLKIWVETQTKAATGSVNGNGTFDQNVDWAAAMATFRPAT